MRLLLVALLFLSIPAYAQTPFAPIPPEQTQGKSTGLSLRVIGYNGSTNREIEVEVQNPTDHSIDFSAKGLYFVPGGSPDHAAQRVGAVGPFQVKTAQGWQRKELFSLASATTTRMRMRMRMDVYCIDSHRASPSSTTSFRMAKDRVPKPMVEAIDQDASRAAQRMGGVSAPRAKSAVQSEVWKNRDKKWIPLDGEGVQEAAK